MRAEAVITLRFSSPRLLNVTLKALKPETRRALSPRSQVQIYGKGKNLTLIFKARDTSSLRAAVNSYLRWMLLTTTVVESVTLVDSRA